MAELSQPKKAQRLRIYVGESDRWRGKPLDAVLVETLRAQHMAGTTVFRGVAGFGAHSHIHSTQLEVVSFDLPVVIEVVDTPEKISGVLEVIEPMVREGLITLEDVQIVKYTHRFLNPLPADKLVSEVMTRDVIRIAPAMPVAQAWKLMLEKTVKALPVVEPGGKVVGMLTDEDLLKRAGIQQRLSVALRMEKAELTQELESLRNSPQTAGDVMTHPVVTVNDHASLGAATALMIKTGLKRLPVVDGSGRLVGILSRLDILRQVAGAPQEPTPTHLPAGAVQTVKDIMSANIPLVHEDDDLSEIVEKFSQTGSHRLIVVDRQDKAAGLVSDSDVVSRIQPENQRSFLDALHRIGRPPAGKETARDLMSSGLLTAPPDLSVVEAAQRMLADSRKWLVVVDDEGKPAGLVDRQILLESIGRPMGLI